MIRVSAVIPCYNCESTIERAILSCVRQSFKPIEIIIVNDGSTDESKNVLIKLQKIHHLVKVINQENKGVCEARNKGIKAASGEYLLMLDADDYFEPSFVEKALKIFQSNRSHAAVMSGYNKIKPGHPSKTYFFKPVDLKSCLYDNGMLACVLFKKEPVIGVGMYDPKFKYAHEDWDLNIRLLLAGYSFGIINEPLYNYTSSEHSRSSLSIEQDIEMRSIIYKKYEAYFKQHGLYLFECFSRERIHLRKQNKRIIESRSFILSEQMVKIFLKIKRMIGLK